MRSDKDLRSIKQLDIMFSKGGLGDSIARLPAVNYILCNNKHIEKTRLFIQDYFVKLAQHLLSVHINSGRLQLVRYSDMEEELRERPSTHAVMTDSEHHTTLRTHLTDHAFHTLADCGDPEPGWKSYLTFSPTRIRQMSNEFTKWNKGNYIVITTGFTAPNREWLPSEVNKVVDWCVENAYMPVFLGKTESVFWGTASTKGWFREEINFSKGINLIDKTDLLEAGKIMANAAAVIGLDNGLIHLAATTNVPIVAAYTTVSHKHRAPYRKGKLAHNMKIIEPPESLACGLCQTKMSFVYQFDFRQCYYNDYKCLNTITGERFIEALKEILYVRPKYEKSITASRMRQEFSKSNKGSSEQS